MGRPPPGSYEDYLRLLDALTYLQGRLRAGQTAPGVTTDELADAVSALQSRIEGHPCAIDPETGRYRYPDRVPPDDLARSRRLHGPHPDDPPGAGGAGTSLDDGRRPSETSPRSPATRDGGPKNRSLRVDGEQTHNRGLPPCCNGNVYSLLCERCGYIYEVPARCKRRTCADCAHVRYLELVARLAPLQEHLEHPKFLTVTLKRGSDPGAMVDRIIKAFNLLRRRPLFKGQRGGFYSIEVKPPYEGEGWNVHLHALIDGPYVPQEAIADAWEDLTGDSRIVDVRKCRKPSSAIAYILGYTSQGPKIQETWDRAGEELKKAYENAVKGRRLLQTFGHLHGIKVPKPPLQCPECQAHQWTLLDFDPYMPDHFGITHFRGTPSPQQPLFELGTPESRRQLEEIMHA